MSGHLQSKIKVAGHLRDKRDVYQMELSWRGHDGKRNRCSKSTGLKVKGNKKRAEAMLSGYIAEMETELNGSGIISGLLFADFMEEWVSSMKPPKVKLTTYGGYQNNVKQICNYFRPKGILLSELTADHINDFYDEALERITAMTVLKYHANINSALKYAVKKKKVPFSVMGNVERPSPEEYVAKPLKESEVVALFEAVRGHKLELAVILGAFYGMRRSEVVGLRWNSIDFDTDSFIIDHTVTSSSFDGKKILVAEDTTKTKSSRRTLPLIPCIKIKLQQLKAEQERNKKLCGRSYNYKDKEYVYVDPLGNRIKPDSLTTGFPKFLEKNGFRRARYHDLRHSSASLLLGNGVSLKQIQEWLGHSDFAITANIYAHIEFASKIDAALSMTWIEKTSLGKLAEESDCSGALIKDAKTLSKVGGAEAEKQ